MNDNELDILSFKKEENDIVIDVRNDYEIEMYSYPDSLDIELYTLLENPEAYLDNEHHYYILCRSGVRSRYATQELLKLGYNATNLTGGIQKYLDIIY